jgi:aspartyl-tRNA synthetase
MSYDEMRTRFGTDKADLRFGMELTDIGASFHETQFRAFAGVTAKGGQIKAIVAPGGAGFSRKQLDDLVTDTKGRGAAGLVWMAVESNGGIRSPVEKHVSAGEVARVLEATSAVEGDLVLIVADKPDRVAVALDGLRRDLGERLGLIPENEWKFVWMVEPPLFEWSDEEERWVSMHHPFTAPAGDDLEPATAKARGYDLVLNGFEVGGGSIRIHQPDVQRRVFEMLGLEDGEIEEKFGHLLTAFRYGVPPHGGIAMGVDRIVMLMAEAPSLRDVTAFPKAQSGADPLTGAPAPASPEQLRELGLKVIAEPAKPPAGSPGVEKPEG